MSEDGAMKKELSIGTIIMCPACGAELLEVISTIKADTFPSGSQFRKRSEKVKTGRGCKMECFCGASYFESYLGMFFTKERGWQ